MASQTLQDLINKIQTQIVDQTKTLQNCNNTQVVLNKSISDLQAILVNLQSMNL